MDRRDDLAFLEERWESDDLEMVVVTGRRRVGKTTLLKKFMEGKPHVYHLVNQEEASLQRRRLRDALVEELGGPRPEVDDWHDLFAYLEDGLEDRDRFLLVVDEFPYLVEEDDGVPSYFQALLDEYLAGTRAFVCLCGSSIGMMEEEVLASKSPLYGRRTGRVDLRPFTFAEARELFPAIDLGDLVRIYAVFGGTPHYLRFVEGGTAGGGVTGDEAPGRPAAEAGGDLQDQAVEDVAGGGVAEADEAVAGAGAGGDVDLAGAIEDLICNPRGPLHDEPELLLRQEFRRPNRYVSIVQAVAAGRTTPKTIADHTGIPQQSVPKYLGELQRVRLLDHVVPVTEQTKRSRQGVYRLADPFFRFWFRFVAPHISQAEEDPAALARNRILPELPAHTGFVFEEICRQLVPRLFEGYGRVGGWWYQEAEVDVVALDESGNRLLAGECKWREDVDAVAVLDDLRRTANRIRWRGQGGGGREGRGGDGGRGGGRGDGDGAEDGDGDGDGAQERGREETYVIFARSFERRTPDARCLDLADLDEEIPRAGP